VFYHRRVPLQLLIGNLPPRNASVNDIPNYAMRARWLVSESVSLFVTQLGQSSPALA
jgi:hypothetical protein